MVTRSRAGVRPAAVQVGLTQQGSDPAAVRRLEIALGLATWWILLSPLWGLGVLGPAWPWLIAGFGALWCARVFSFAGFSAVAAWRMKRSLARDWRAEWGADPAARRFRHLIIIPTYREDVAVLAETLRYLVQQDYPLERVSVVLAFEQRDEVARARWRELRARFAGRFGELWATFHPDIEGEVKGKSSNVAWSARRAWSRYVVRGGRDPRHILVTCCDADSRLPPKYLSALAVTAAAEPTGGGWIYQPAILFHGNIWRLPALLRPVNTIYSMHQLSRLVPRYQLVSQSTYSVSLAMAHRVGFWDVDVIPEDSRFFFKSYFALAGRVRVEPIYLPVIADAAEAERLTGTFLTQYSQVRRWSWGASDIPLIVDLCLRRPDIPVLSRLLRTACFVDDHLMRPTTWFVLNLGPLTALAVGTGLAEAATRSVPNEIFTLMMAISGVPMAAVMLLDWSLRPAHARTPRHLVAELLALPLMPLVSLGLLTLPALEAHTRILLGRRLEYQVTPKFAGGFPDGEPAPEVGWSTPTGSAGSPIDAR